MWLTLTFTPLKEKKATKALKKWKRERKWKSKSLQTYLTITRYLYRNTLSFQIQCILWLKFISSEKATKFCEISTLLSLNFVALSEYINFIEKQICNTTRKVHIFLWDFRKNISHKSFEKVEKRGKMEIKESSKFIYSYKILSWVQKRNASIFQIQFIYKQTCNW